MSAASRSQFKGGAEARCSRSIGGACGSVFVSMNIVIFSIGVLCPTRSELGIVPVILANTRAPKRAFPLRWCCAQLQHQPVV